ncbi:hypothetical protein [Pseudomonas extremaustralis]|uniref:Uncharacterized protein n=2 Tax=Pseudomonas extremaustralis TaxID=359110 RepID=A0A5C5QCF6_9PSED|nr:hypothetical protein [Pseudomonas extremaustralis]EZI23343.1 hypothetical protein PE143B_0130530 [Pseudomonas extremaustralis 14-3 substr. 14-3b]EZI26359.1 hypothetical protein PE143B_0121475 [Pseudomonas extremaustralis 14-3 substr. 14-3b]TWS01649.1 hypothetical protein FIV36_23745 [Pseudomonas extremaustralis]TWS02861.1 hypothetical protein FIV36_18055 [Pseudomonas extremaustralis]SDE60396.1 hypothetical protein SAMN05216591_0346 [Pseudomonas extremaustralis]
MNDQQILELAAKAAGIGPVLCFESARNCLRIGDRESYRLWRPLDDDGDALRLAIRLGICIVFMEDHDSVGAEHSRHGVMIIEAMDDFGTRRAIVRAAADIAKATA